MPSTRAYAAFDARSPLAPFELTRRELRPEDVHIEIRYCGVCHSDLHGARNDWGRTVYPLVPGHEIVGDVRRIGGAVTRFRVGQTVAVGCLVDSCRSCGECCAGREQYCEGGATVTYNGKDRITGEPTYGGYSSDIVVREDFVVSVPEELDVSRVAPLLCAGITSYSPLRHWKVGPGSRIAVAGLGGLGHMGVKLAVGLGAHVTVLTSSESKREDALRLGAHEVVLTSDKQAMRSARRHFDFILDTIPVAHELEPFLHLLRFSGTVVLVGAIEPLPSFHSGLIVGGRRTVAGSAIGGIAETAELLEFCAAKQILPDCTTISIRDINQAYEKMLRNDVKYRFVIDMATLADA